MTITTKFNVGDKVIMDGLGQSIQEYTITGVKVLTYADNSGISISYLVIDPNTTHEFVAPEELLRIAGQS